MMKYFSICIAFIISILAAHSAEITYRIDSYNADAGEYVLAACGERPVGAYAYFRNEYGETSGNRYNQLPRNREAQLYLFGWEGCAIRSITFSMCSNNKAGTIGFSVKDGETELYNMRPVDFNSEDWFGQWVSKDLGIYVDIKKELNLPASTTGDITLNLKAGTREGSVYINAITIEYETAEGIQLESPLGYVFEKMEAKGTLSEGDVIMLYRSGNAAGNIDGMETSKYLDAIGITSTNNVTEPSALFFTLAHDESNEHWTLTNQYGEMLGASGAQSLVWDEGVTTWNIKLGYDGATVSSTNSKYGTLRFNAPAESYARFWNYTSTSLPLPYIYRRTRQLSPTLSKELQLSASERTIELGSQDTLAIKATLLPATTTDRRILWSSSNPEVATVRNGIITPLQIGTATITAVSADGASSASLTLNIVEASSIHNPQSSIFNPQSKYTLDGYRVNTSQKNKIVIINGKKYLE